MPGTFNPDEEKVVKNHMPTVVNLANLFLQAFDHPIKDEEALVEYLLEVINTMEKDIAEVKTMLDNH